MILTMRPSTRVCHHYNKPVLKNPAMLVNLEFVRLLNPGTFN